MKIFLSMFLVFMTCYLHSQEKKMDNPEVFLKSLKKINANTSSVSADFSQEKSSSYLKEKQFSSGKFYSQGENMRWEQQKPSYYALLISSGGIKVKEGNKEREFGAAADKFLEQLKAIIMTSINGNFTENNDFSPTYFQDEKFNIVKLKPENRKLTKMFDQIILKFDKTTSRLKVLTFVQKDGSSSMYFKNEAFNKTLPASLFTQF